MRSAPFLQALALGAVLLLILVITRFGYWPGSRLAIVPTESLAALLPGVLLAHTNQDRVLNGVSLLAENPLLDQAADLKAKDMLSRQYYAHVGPDGSTALDWLDKVGYRYINVGENLDLTYGGDETEIESAWMNSPEHRSNILLPLFTQVGVAIESGNYKGAQVTFAVEEFATPASAKAASQPAPATPSAVPQQNPSTPAKPAPAPQASVPKMSAASGSQPSVPSSSIRVILTPVPSISAETATDAAGGETGIPSSASSSTPSSEASAPVAPATPPAMESATASQFIGLVPGSGLHSNIKTSSWSAFFDSLRTATSAFLIFRYSQADNLSF